MPVRLPVVVALIALGVGCGLVATVVLGARPRGVPSAARPAGAVVAGESPPAVVVLDEWDAARAAAWARGDPAALARLYTARSSAGAADVALLRRYRARGIVVTGMRMQVLRARVVEDRPRRVVLEVTDRLAAATAAPYAGHGAGRRLPVDAATTRLLELRRVGDRWLMARVSVPAGGR